MKPLDTVRSSRENCPSKALSAKKITVWRSVLPKGQYAVLDALSPLVIGFKRSCVEAQFMYVASF